LAFSRTIRRLGAKPAAGIVMHHKKSQFWIINKIGSLRGPVFFRLEAIPKSARRLLPFDKLRAGIGFRYAFGYSTLLAKTQKRLSVVHINTEDKSNFRVV
jgi:hypothetical protein